MRLFETSPDILGIFRVFKNRNIDDLAEICEMDGHDFGESPFEAIHLPHHALTIPTGKKHDDRSLQPTPCIYPD